MFRRACGVFREPKCGECVEELMTCFGSLWNVSGACGMFGSLWNISESLWNVAEKRIASRTIWPHSGAGLGAMCMK